MKPALTLASLCLLLAAPAGAQGLPPAACGNDEPFIDCFNRIEGAVLEAAVAQEVHEETAKKLASEGSAAGEGSLRDTLASFFGALDLGTISREGQSITLNFNPNRFRLGPHNKISFGVEMREPEVFSNLIDEVPEDDRANRKDELGKQLEDLDDMTVSVAWNREDQRFGRNSKPHKKLLKAVAGFEENTQALIDLLPGTGIELSSSRSSVPESRRAQAGELERRLVAMALAVQERLTDDPTFISKDLSLLDDLLNNQPQLEVSGSLRERADLVGRDEILGKVSYEWGWANLNAYRRSLDGAEPNPVNFTAFLQDNDLLAADGGPGPMLKYGLRLSTSLEYARLRPYHFELPDDGVVLDLKNHEKWTGSLSLGSAIAFDAEGNATSRWELEGSYVRVEDDPTRPETRILGTLSVIQELTDGSSVSLGLVYANKPELLEAQDVDHEISARVGLKYSLDRKPGSTGGG